jgi:hypothetical protein
LRCLLPSLLLIGLNTFVFTPFTLYHGSPREFKASYLDILLQHAIGFATLMVIGLILGSLLINVQEKARTRALALIFGIGVLQWIQSSFMMWDYGDLDGRGIVWQSFGWQGYLDAAVWIGVMVHCCRSPGFWIGISRLGSSALILMQIALMVGLSIFSKEPLWSDPSLHVGHAPQPGHFQFSEKLNVIHILLDSFQSDVFLELVKEESFEDDLDGFTLFFDNAAVASSTTFSLPAIFSGKIYDGSLPANEYYDQAIKSGISDHLYGLGYRVRLTPVRSMHASRSTSYFPTPSQYTADGGGYAFHEAVFLFDVSLFRLSPHFFRHLVYNENSWLLSDMMSKSPNETSFQHKAFFRDYASKLSVVGTAPAYHFVHLNPPHPPYVTLPNGSSAGKPLAPTRENFKNEAKYILRVFVFFLDRLRELGLYDSALIVLQGDHGSRFDPIVDGVAKPGLPLRSPALLTVKPPGAKGPLRLSRVPSSVSDVPATLQALLGLEHEFPGTSVYELTEGEERERLYIVYRGDQEDPEILQYRLMGSVYGSENWSLKGKVRVAQDVMEEYKWGEPVQFGVAGNATPYLGTGWTTPMSRSSWNNGTEASLNFLLPPTQSELELEIHLKPFLFPGVLDRQRVRVSIGSVEIGEWVLTENAFQRVRMTIPNESISGPNVKISLGLPDAESPIQINAGADVRKLAIAVSSLRLREK